MNKIIFMGTPEFSVKALEALQSNENISIELVITQQDKQRSRGRTLPTAIKKRAIELGLKTYEPKSVNSKESLDLIDSINPDYIVVIAYGQIIGDHLLEKYKDRIINIHSSLLPKYRGAAPMQFALLSGDSQTGVCSMLIEKSMDTGDILKCRSMEITEQTDIEDIHDKLSIVGADLILDTILNYENYYEKRIKQDHSKATYTKKITKEMGHLDFNKSSKEIDLTIRAFRNWPSAFAVYKDQNMKIHKISIIPKYNEIENGKIFKVDNTGIYVNCQDACIIMEHIQLPNKRKMSVEEYLRGNSIEEGILFR